jgi:hypothetical protein
MNIKMQHLQINKIHVHGDGILLNIFIRVKIQRWFYDVTKDETEVLTAAKGTQWIC